jgi:hypothetical protein
MPALAREAQLSHLHPLMEVSDDCSSTRPFRVGARRRGGAMTYRTARRGGAIAGALLFAMPLIEVFYGMASPGPVHFVIGSFGLALLLLCGRLR